MNLRKIFQEIVTKWWNNFRIIPTPTHSILCIIRFSFFFFFNKLLFHSLFKVEFYIKHFVLGEQSNIRNLESFLLFQYNLTLPLTLPYFLPYLTLPYILPYLTIPYVLTLPYYTLP